MARKSRQSVLGGSRPPPIASGVRDIASWHVQGKSVALAWYGQGSAAPHPAVLATSANDGQTLLPHLVGDPTAPAGGELLTRPAKPFGFKIDYEWSDDAP